MQPSVAREIGGSASTKPLSLSSSSFAMNVDGRAFATNSIEVAIADERIQVSLIGDSVVIPVIWIDAAIRGFDLVRARHEVAVLEESSLYMYATQSGKFASG